MQPTKEEKHRKEIAKLKQELSCSKKKIKSLEGKLSTSERNRRSLMESNDKKKESTEQYLYNLLNDINTLNS